MYEIKFIDDSHTLTIQSSKKLTTSFHLAKDLVQYLNTMNNKTPLSRFDVWVPDNEPNKLKFSYRYILKDGRRWNQTIQIPNGDASTKMTFVVVDQWKLEEFSLHRPVRDVVVVPMLTKWGVTKIICIWN